MAHALSWSRAALADLDEIEAYIASQSPLNAQRVIERVFAAADKLRDFPFSARMVPEWQDPQIRETLVHSYRVIYRVGNATMEVVAVFHGKRMLSAIADRFEEQEQEAYVFE
jgi:plasmid stabilization system protein ParE